MFPSIHAENRLDINRTRRQTHRRTLGMSTHRSSELITHRRVLRVCSHVDGLTTRVSGWVGRAGVVGAEDLHEALAFEVLCEPDEAGTEHGAGGGEEVQFQGFDGRAGVDDVCGEFFGDLGGGWGLGWMG